MVWPNLVTLFETNVLLYFLAINGMYTFLFLLAFFEVRKQHKRAFIDDYDYFYKSKLAPSISLLVTAHNEELCIVESVKSYLALQYPKLEVIVINDGSTDGTLELLKRTFKLKKVYRVLQARIKCQNIKGYYVSQLYSNLIVLDKIQGGKGDALNAGLNAARYPYFASLDADAILEKDALLRIMKPLYENPNYNIGAGGIVRVINGCRVENSMVKDVRLSKNPLVIVQVLEYIRAFTAGRAGFALLKALPIVSGAFSVYRTVVARRIGGYDPKALGEDFEFVVRFHRALRERKKRYNLMYRAYPICWTEVPETLKLLGRQRNRWYRGLTYALHKHERMLLNPLYGRIGFLSLPFFFFFEFLGPIIEGIGYVYLAYYLLSGRMLSFFVLTFLALALLWGVFLSLLAVLFEDLNFHWYNKWYNVATLILFAFLENIFYRPLHTFWRLTGLVDYLRGKKGWGIMERKGFQTAPAK